MKPQAAAGAEAAADEVSLHEVPLREALAAWVRIALHSFGGPAGQIAVMHRVLVEEKRWLSEARFLHALNYCMLLPGPEAQQLATYAGWLLHRVKGGLLAGGLFVLPGFLSILLLSVLYAGFQDLEWVRALFYGLKPAVLALVVLALWRLAGKALLSWPRRLLAIGSFVAIFVFSVPFPWIVGVAALGGWLRGRWGRQRESVQDAANGGEGVVADAPIGDQLAQLRRPDLHSTLRTAALWLALWLLPLILLRVWLGPSHVLAQEGALFSKTAVLTFGGAYAALAYIAQQGVEVYGWLQPGEMLDGLGLAETTPGPLIQVVQFVGFLGAYRHPGSLDPMLAGVLGSLVTTWATFAPCFLWIFVGAPYMEALRGRRDLAAALSAITAAVVGVILNLALWFALNTLFAELQTWSWGWMQVSLPRWSTLDPAAVLLAGLAFLALFRLRLGMLPTLALCTLTGMVWALITAVY